LVFGRVKVIKQYKQRPLSQKDGGQPPFTETSKAKPTRKKWDRDVGKRIASLERKVDETPKKLFPHVKM